MAGRLAATLGNLCLGPVRQQLPASTSAAMLFQKRLLRTGTVLGRSKRDEHGAGTKQSDVQKDIVDGLVGGGQSGVVVPLSGWESRLPTPETLKQEFNGILYPDLPRVYIKATKNNTLIQAMDKRNRVIMYTSCRVEGFKNARKKTSIAGQTTGVAAGQKLVRRGVRTVTVQVKGVGPGRMTSVKGLTAAGVTVVSITDHTPLKELGPRPKKIRRV